METTLPGSISVHTVDDGLSKFLPKSVVDKVTCPRIPEMLVRQVSVPSRDAFANLLVLAYVAGFGQNIWYTRSSVRTSSTDYEHIAQQEVGGYSVWDFGRFHYPDPSITPQIDWQPTPALPTVTGDAAIRATGTYTRVPGFDQNTAISLLARIANADCSGYLFRLGLAIGELVLPAFDSLMPEFAAIVHHSSYYWFVDIVSNFNANAIMYRLELITVPVGSDNCIFWSNAINNLSPIAQIMLLKAFAPLFRIEWLLADSPGNLNYRRWDLDVNDRRTSATNSVVCYKYASMVAGRDPSNAIVVYIVVPEQLFDQGIVFCGQVLDANHNVVDLTHQIIEQTIQGANNCHAAANQLYNFVRQLNPTLEEFRWFFRGLMFEWGDRFTCWPRNQQHSVFIQPDDTVNTILDWDVGPAFLLFAGCRFGDGLPLIIRRPQPSISLSPIGLRSWGFKAGEPYKYSFSLNDARTLAWRAWMCVSWLTTPSMARPLEFNTHYSVYAAVWGDAPTIQMVERFDLREACITFCGATLHYTASEWLSTATCKVPRPISENIIDRVGGELILMQDANRQTIPSPVKFSNPGFSPCRYGHSKTNDTRYAYRAAYYYHPDYVVRFHARLPSTTPYQPVAQPTNFTQVGYLEM